MDHPLRSLPSIMHVSASQPIIIATTTHRIFRTIIATNLVLGQARYTGEILDITFKHSDLQSEITIARIRPLQVAFRFLVRAFSSQDAGGRVYSLSLSNMTTKIHNGKTDKRDKCKSLVQHCAVNNDQNCVLSKWGAGGGPETGYVRTTWSGLIYAHKTWAWL